MNFRYLIFIVSLLTASAMNAMIEGKIASPRKSKKSAAVAPIDNAMQNNFLISVQEEHNTKVSSVVPFDASLDESVLEHDKLGSTRSSSKASEVEMFEPEMVSKDNKLDEISLYDQALDTLANTSKKQNSMLRKMTGTVAYKNSDKTTIVHNSMTGTISYKDKKGQIVKELTKNSNGTATETVYSHTSSELNGNLKDEKLKEETTYATNDRSGKRTTRRTVTNNIFISHSDGSVLTTHTMIENYDESGKLTSSMDHNKNITIYPKNPQDSVKLYSPDFSKKSSLQSINPTTDSTSNIQVIRRPSAYNKALQQFLSEQVTGRTGSIINSAQSLLL